MVRSLELDVQDHFLTENIPPEIAENWKEIFPEHEDLSCEEVLLQQVNLNFLILCLISIKHSEETYIEIPLYVYAQAVFVIL